MSNMSWRLPPQPCPDYWVDTGISGCYNIKGLGTCTSAMIGKGNENEKDKYKHYYMNFENLEGGNTLCNKQKWANKCNISWDGITYGYGTNPC